MNEKIQKIEESLLKNNQKISEYKAKIAKLQKSNSTVTENDDGTTTWVIRYKFTQAGENTYSVSTRGTAWSEAKTFTTTVA